MIPESIRSFIDRAIEASSRRPGDASPAERAEFDRLALEAFRFQYESVPLYRRLCDLRGRDPSSVAGWREVPAAPADLFKESLGVPEPPGATVFLSSGTSAGAERRSRHVVSAESYELYRRSSMAHFSAMVLPDTPGPMSVLVLAPTAATHPDSSLGHMYGFAVEAFAADTGDPATFLHAFDRDGRADISAATSWLEAAASATRPVLILALSTTLTALFEALRASGRPLRLPADSRIVDTGGSKGGRTLSRNGILKAAWRFLHIPAYLCVAEYGMTELLSQFYDDAFSSRWSGTLRPRAKVGPAWVRTVVVDPATLEPVPSGTRGLLRHVDLANCESISAVQTLDVGVEVGAGFEVLGRASGSEARGCSQLMSVVTGSRAR
jgi:hypothetical protein